MDLDSCLDLLRSNLGDSLDLGEVAFRLAQEEYADLDVEAYLSELDGMAHEARGYMTGNLEARASGLCRFLFHDMGFHGNVRNYYDPRNSYLNEVLDRRTGIPIALSMMAMAVGERAGLEIAGVGLPGHFIAKAVDGEREVLFDPFHGGRVLTHQDCENVVLQVTGQSFQIGPKSLEAVPLARIVQRVLGNLKTIYLQDSDFTRAIRVLGRLRQLSPRDTTLQRDLGISLFRSGQSGKAIDHLLSYLDGNPQGKDVNDVRRMLHQARGEVAKWN